MSAWISGPAPAARPMCGVCFGPNVTTELSRFSNATPEASRKLSQRIAALVEDGPALDASSTESTMKSVRHMHGALKTGFDVTSGDAPEDQVAIAQQGTANCFGSTQLFLATARARGLDARPIQIMTTTSGVPTQHVASLVHLPDGRVATVDVLYPDAVSEPFHLEERYERRGDSYVLRPHAQGTHYGEMRVLDDAQFNAFLSTRSLEGSVAERIERREIAAGIDPDNPFIRGSLGTAYRDALESPELTDRFGAAHLQAASSRELLAAERLAPNVPTFPLELGLLHEATGRRLEAANAFERAAAAFAKSGDAKAAAFYAEDAARLRGGN